MQKVTLAQFLKIAMANNGMTARDVAEARGTSEGSLSTTMNQKSVNLRTLEAILETMDEKVVLQLKNGQSYEIKTE